MAQDTSRSDRARERGPAPQDHKPPKSQRRDDPDGPYFDLHWKGRLHRVEPGDYSAVDDEWLFDRFGVDLINAFSGEMSVRVLAGLLYLVKSRRNSDLTYEDVASTFTLNDLAESEYSDGQPDDGGDGGAGEDPA